jgi:ribokinase
MAAATVAGERGWSFILNPAPAAPLADDLLRRCDVLTPNEHELEGLGRSSAQELLAAGAGAVIVTQGAQGADLFRPGAPAHHQPAFEVEATDTTGAGDAFTGALAWALASGAELTDAIRKAAACGALSTLAPGARGGMPTRAQLENLL